MARSMTIFTEGDWIVHRQYGIGQVQKKEKKTISGNREEYYRVKTPDSEIWLPVNKIDMTCFRPISSPREINEALDILKNQPQQMDPNFANRKSRIAKVQSENSIPAIATLIRDLRGRKEHKALSSTEQTALRHLTDRFIAEWSVCMKIDDSNVRNKLNMLLEISKNSLPQ